jgi:lysine-specific demethylase/histidyl-hydroxylase NO66
MMVKLQDSFKAEAKKKIMRVCKEALELITTGCDQMAKRFLSDRLPPAFTAQELAHTSESRAENGGKIWPNTMVRLAKPGIAHLVVEGDKAVIYHNADNSRVYHETPLSPLEFEIDDAPALEALVTTVEPHWICVRDLLHGDIEDKMEIAQALYDEGILAIFQNEAPDTSVQTG